MAAETVRKAIQDAVVAVSDYAKKNSPAQAARLTYWRPEVPPSIPEAEVALYRETYEIAAKHAAALLAEFN